MSSDSFERVVRLLHTARTRFNISEKDRGLKFVLGEEFRANLLIDLEPLTVDFNHTPDPETLFGVPVERGGSRLPGNDVKLVLELDG